MGAFVIIAFALYPFLWIPALFTGNLTFDSLATYIEGFSVTTDFWGDLFKLVIETIFS